MRVLIADDDETILFLVRTVVEQLGHEPLLARDGAQAWAAFQREPVQLAVLDIEMPGLDGLALTRRIRDRDADHETFVVILTGRSGPDDLDQVLDAGADDYLTKPTTPENLRARLLITQQRMAHEAKRRAVEKELAEARWLSGVGQTRAALQHEINNPLSALLGHTELMLMDAQDRGEENEHLRVIYEQARRIAEVVKRLNELRNPKTVDYVAGAQMIDLSGHPKGNDGP